MKLIDILYENTQANEKFVNYLIPKLTEYFENLYADTDWLQAAYNLLYSSKGPYEYQAAGMNANIQMKELKEFLGSTKNVLTTDVSHLQEIRQKILTKTKLIDKNLYMLIHLREMFNSMRQGNFMDTYSVPPAIMIEVWDRWMKEVYEPAAKKRETTYAGRELVPISQHDIKESDWSTYNPDFGQQHFWSTYSPGVLGDGYYVTSNYLSGVRGKEPLMYVAKDVEDLWSFIDAAEMDMAIEDLNQYFTKVGARQVINFIRQKPGGQYNDPESEETAAELIGEDIKEYVDEHPEIDFSTDGGTEETFTHIGEILNDYLHY